MDQDKSLNGFVFIALSEVFSQQNIQVGNKALNLSRLIKAQFNVPDGFAIAIPEEFDPLNINLFQQSVIHEMWHEFDKHFDRKDFKVAVRSSSLEEDSDEYSFAGQFESYLNISNIEDLILAIMKCIQSSQSLRVHAYRREFGLSSKRFGVIVQTMIQAEYSGVCFTESHLSEKLLSIDTIKGFGDELVSGSKTPIRTTYNRSYPYEKIESSEKQENDCFPEWAKNKLLDEALRAEKLFEHPLDIEWAFDGSRIWLLQARALTHIRQALRRDSLIQKELERIQILFKNQDRIWTDSSIGDVLENPSWLTLDAFNEATLSGSGVEKAYKDLGLTYHVRSSRSPVFQLVFGRAYIDLTEYLERLSKGLPVKVCVDENRKLQLKWSVRHLSFKDKLCLPFRLSIRPWLILFKMLSLRKKFHKEFLIKTAPFLENKARIERERDLRTLSDSELFHLLNEFMRFNRNELSYYHLLTDVISFFTQAIVKLGLVLVYGKSEAKKKELDLTTGLEGNFNTETNLALCELAQEVITIDQFLKRFGHRGNPDWEISAPRWREEQAKILKLSNKIGTDLNRGRAEFQKQVETRKERECEFHVDLGKKMHTRFLRPFFMHELAYYQIYSPLREQTQSICYMWVELSRLILREMSRRLEVQEGVQDFIYYLQLDEIKDYFFDCDRRKELITYARMRKSKLKMFRSVYLPHLIDSKSLHQVNQPPKRNESQSDLGLILKGEPVCRGYISGRARVVKSLEEASDIQKGDIIVTQFTDPAWTPLFMIAGGLVLEQGSSFSHGAIVAREIGLPALVNVVDGTYLIQSGQWITLDANEGQVILNVN